LHSGPEADARPTPGRVGPPLATRTITGSLTATPIDGEDSLAFILLEGVRPMVESLPLERGAAACARMMEGKARFRMVLFPR
jgi:alcohol dehydrogenase